MSDESYKDGAAYCGAIRGVVTLRCNVNGLIVCRQWKKCPHHSEECVEGKARKAMEKHLRAQRKKRADIGKLVMQEMFRRL